MHSFASLPHSIKANEEYVENELKPQGMETSAYMELLRRALTEQVDTHSHPSHPYPSQPFHSLLLFIPLPDLSFLPPGCHEPTVLLLD